MNLELLTQKAVQAAIDAGQLISSYGDTEVDVLKKDAGSTLASQVVTEAVSYTHLTLPTNREV